MSTFSGFYAGLRQEEQPYEEMTIVCVYVAPVKFIRTATKCETINAILLQFR